MCTGQQLSKYCLAGVYQANELFGPFSTTAESSISTPTPTQSLTGSRTHPFIHSLTISQFNGIVVTRIIIRFEPKFHCFTQHAERGRASERAQQNNYAKTSSIISINRIQLTFDSMLSFHISISRHISLSPLSPCHSFSFYL